MSSKLKKIAIIGATSAIAEHCARLWLKSSPVEFVLVGRDLEKTKRIAADLQVHSPESRIKPMQVDFVDPVKISLLVDEIMNEDAVDIVLIAHGSLLDQQHCQENLSLCHQALTINGVSPALFAEAFAGHMQRADKGTLVIISSVAGDRGRKSNYIYGAAKGLLSRYAQGLQHRLANTGVKVVLVKPGPTATPMTEHLVQQGGKLANVEDVARSIVNGAAKGKSVIYAPGKWAVIMLIIRHLPFIIFKHLNI